MIKNIDRIHPCKREKVLRGMEYVEEVNRDSVVIPKVFIFGSSVTADCSDESDIDVGFVSNVPMGDVRRFEFLRKLPSVMDDLCDVFEINDFGGRLKQEVLQKGVVVYES